MHRRRWTKLLGVLLSTGALAWVVSSVRYEDLSACLRRADYRFLPIGVGLYLVSNVLRARLGRELLGGSERGSTGRLFGHLMIGLLANNVLPARLGELVRAHSVARDLGLSRTRVFSSIVVERLLDVLWLLVFSLAALAIPLSQQWPLRLACATGAVLLGAIGAAVLFWSQGERACEWISRWVPSRHRLRLRNELAYYLCAGREGCRVIATPGGALTALAFSLASWVAWVLFLGVSLAMFSVSPGAMGLLFLTGAINLTVMIPAAPGYVGTFQFACVQSLALFGVPPEQALGFSVVFHASWYLVSTALGALFMALHGVSLSGVSRNVESEPTGSP